MEKKDRYDFADLIKVMETLLGENGCPWDKAQTHQSLKRYMLEECYEVIDAIENNDNVNLCEELGDVLLQVVFHSQLAKNDSEFSLEDVIDGICKKMINRHRHIFYDVSVNGKEEIENNWENIKKEEKGYENQTQVLKSVPKVLPALIRCEKVQKKAAHVGIEYENIDAVFENIQCKLDNLNKSKNVKNSKNMEGYGELLFAIINISRFFKLNPEFALTNALEKFINRFEYIESCYLDAGKSLDLISAQEINSLLNNSKQ